MHLIGLKRSSLGNKMFSNDERRTGKTDVSSRVKF